MPVDPARIVAGAVGSRADRVETASRRMRARVTERQPGDPAAGDEGDDRVRAVREPGGSRAASWPRQHSQTAGAPARAPARRREEGGSEDDAVGDHRQEERLDVLRLHVGRVPDERPGPRRPARARASREPRRGRATVSSCAGCADEPDDPALDQLVDVDVLDGPLERRVRRRRRRPGAGAPSGCPCRWSRTIASSSARGRVAEREPQEEAVELGLRQREGALVLDRVLGREQEERRRAARACSPSTVTCRSAIASSSADCVFGIARLISSTSSDVREDRARAGIEVARLLVEDREAGDVGRLQVGRALDARRRVAPSTLCASARASTVFAVPGTSSISTWPRQASAASTSRISVRLPRTTRSTFSRSWPEISAGSTRPAARTAATAARRDPDPFVRGARVVGVLRWRMSQESPNFAREKPGRRSGRPGLGRYDWHMAVTAKPKLDAASCAPDFPIFEQPIHGKPLAFLDSAATSQKPRQVLDAMTRLLRDVVLERPPRRLQLAERATEGYEGAREKVRAFVNAPSTREVIFIRNATEALNLVAYAWGLDNLGPGDVAARHRARAPLQLRAVAVDRAPHGRRLPDAADRRPRRAAARPARRDRRRRRGSRSSPRTSSRTRSGRSTRSSGSRAWAHERGAIMVCDAAQAAPHRRMDVQALGADFVAFSWHKMCGPSGVGRPLGPRRAARGDGSPFLTTAAHDPLGRGSRRRSGTSCRTSSRRGRRRSPRRTGSASAIDYLADDRARGDRAARARAGRVRARAPRRAAVGDVYGPPPTGARASSRSTSTASTRTTSRRCSTRRASRSAPATTAASR